MLWPGDSRWLPFVDYPLEGDEAIKSGRLLASYLARRFAGVNSLSFVSHSLGARTMLETIRNLDQSFQLRTLTVMAAAIDDTCLVNEYRDAAQRLEKISVLASSEDEVLKLAFPAGNFASGIVSRGDPYWHGALGRYGPYPRINRRICARPRTFPTMEVRPSQLYQLRLFGAWAATISAASHRPAPGYGSAQQCNELAAGMAAGFVSTRFA